MFCDCTQTIRTQQNKIINIQMQTTDQKPEEKAKPHQNLTALSCCSVTIPSVTIAAEPKLRTLA